MGPCERAICLSLFVCLAMAVFTTVGLIYLTAIVYNPVKNELEAGFLTNPVMCTSILNQTVREYTQAFELCIVTTSCQVDCNVEKGSCYEWCISDPGGECTKIWVEVRQNGTDAMFYECSDVRI